MSVMAEISLDSLVPRANGPVASVFVVAPGAGGRTSVLKVYPQPLDRRTVNAVEVEQAKLAGIRSASSVLRVDSVDELPDGRTGLRMEFCPQALPDLVASGPLPIGDVVVLGQILASVLAQVHELGIVHGGVTPSNVVERSNGQPALADFGMALRLRFPRDLMGDAAYTAPEVLRDGELSEQADVYGLGAVLYLALAGQSPFPARTGETADDVVLRVLREPPAPVSGRDVAPSLANLLRRMLAKEPDARPAADEVVRELETLLLTPDDGLDFDDFRDELAAPRLTHINPAFAPAPVKTPGKRQWKKPSKGLVITGAAAVALLAVVPVMLQPGSPEAQPQQTTVPLPTPTQPTPAVQINLKTPQDNGTSVLLEWTSDKSLTYAIHMAEQGGEHAQMIYKGSGTSLTVKVSPGLKYCFEVQATDATAIYFSKAQPIRGATCAS
jgi:serine/threonine protein kinase